jgi:hypothetical protein
MKTDVKKFLLAAISLLVATPASAAPICTDILYIADNNVAAVQGDDFVARFDAETGGYLGKLVSPGTPDLSGARGLIFDTQAGPNSNLLVVSQSPLLSTNGAVLVFDRIDGTQLAPLVPSTAPDGPFAPQGIVLGPHNIVYVADIGLPASGINGRVTLWHARTGAYLGDLDPNGFTGEVYRPRGLVFGPDGYLYATNPYAVAGTGGAILKFDTKAGALVDTVYQCSSTATDCDLHRPDGLAFGPDGLLYVTSFRRDASDIDRILIFDVTNTEDPLVDSIDLGGTGDERAFAQGLLFGPDGLYVPISGGGPAYSGSVRIYDVTTELEPEPYTVFVPATSAGGPLVNPRYLTFGQTDPATLAYEGKKQCQ